MKGKYLASSKSRASNEGGEEAIAKQLAGEVMLGDVIWVKLHGDSWWPAQVVDENTVSGSNKPGNRLVGDVLVRLYGSYKYLYVNPIKCQSDFEIILEQNGGCYHEIFKKALEQDCYHSKSGRLKGQGTKCTGATIVQVDAFADKKKNNYQLKHNQEIEVSNYVRVSPRRQLNTITPQTKGKDGNLLSKNVEVKMKPFKQDGMEKKCGSGCPNTEVEAKGNAKRKTLKQGGNHKPKDCSSSAEEAQGKPSKQNGGLKDHKLDRPGVKEKAKKRSEQDGMQKNLKRKNASSDEKANNRTHKQDGVQKKLKQSSPSADEEAKCQSPEQDRVQKKRKPSSGRAEEAVKGKSSKHDGVHKKVKPSRSSTDEVKCKNSNLGNGHKKLKPNSPSVEAEKIKILGQDGVQKKVKLKGRSMVGGRKRKIHKQDEVPKKKKHSGPTADDTNIRTPKQDEGMSLFGKLQELSARRMRVMQNLGLIAPSGSPFHKNGHINLSL